MRLSTVGDIPLVQVRVYTAARELVFVSTRSGPWEAQQRTERELRRLPEPKETADGAYDAKQALLLSERSVLKAERAVADEEERTVLFLLATKLLARSPSAWTRLRNLGIITVRGSSAFAVPARVAAGVLGFIAALLLIGPAWRLLRRWRRRRASLCVVCGYPRHGLAAQRCPECGTPFK
ncbi:MAG: hypothetical protein PVJ57_03135 [Phycisphaerae bacterium]|jgi:hypothetical protein